MCKYFCKIFFIFFTFFIHSNRPKNKMLLFPAKRCSDLDYRQPISSFTVISYHIFRNFLYNIDYYRFFIIKKMQLLRSKMNHLFLFYYFSFITLIQSQYQADTASNSYATRFLPTLFSGHLLFFARLSIKSEYFALLLPEQMDIAMARDSAISSFDAPASSAFL
jgi:hypothetical protein